MAGEQAAGNAGDMMVFGLIEQADRIGKSAQETQRAMTEQIQQLTQLQQWAVQAALELQKRGDATIQKFEAERAQLQGTRVGFERNAIQAMQDAVRGQSSEIERHTTQALAAPLRDIQQAAVQVRQNVRESNWILALSMLSIGAVLGLFAGYLPMRSSVKALQEQVNLIDQYLAAQQQHPVPAAPEPSHTPAHKAKK